MTTLSYIPSPKNDKEYFEISIEGIQFTVKYDYNERQDCWYLTLTQSTTDGNVNWLDSVRMNMGYKFGFNYVNFPITTGWLTLYSPQGYEDDANKDNLGSTLFLVYEVPDDD